MKEATSYIVRTNIFTRRLTKFIRPGNLALGICAPLCS